MTREEDLSALFEEYQFSKVQQDIFHAMRDLRNMPSSFSSLSDEELLWNVAIGTIGMPTGNDPVHSSDLRFYSKKVEERLRRLDMAESQYGWFSLQWTKPTMKRLIQQWFCGMLVIDPDLLSRDGQPIQFVHEYYGPDSGYPLPKDQTDEWKKECMDLYTLMARSICRAYPMATRKGIVTFSDMQDFDWSKYDMGTKERNANIGSVIPNKLARMIAFHPDDKMIGFYNDMTPSARKKFGFEQYSDLEAAVAGESDLLPKELPTFVGGTRRVDILKAMKYLFRREPDALKLLLEVHSEMEAAGEIPKPKHME